jgi:hypothetical protein
VEDEGHGQGLVVCVLRGPPGQGVLRPGEGPHRPRQLRHQEPQGPAGRAAAPGRLERQEVPPELAVEGVPGEAEGGVVEGAD